MDVVRKHDSVCGAATALDEPGLLFRRDAGCVYHSSGCLQQNWVVVEWTSRGLVVDDAHHASRVRGGCLWVDLKV
jgi:hypothetical protein